MSHALCCATAAQVLICDGRRTANGAGRDEADGRDKDRGEEDIKGGRGSGGGWDKGAGGKGEGISVFSCSVLRIFTSRLSISSKIQFKRGVFGHSLLLLCFSSIAQQSLPNSSVIRCSLWGPFSSQHGKRREKRREEKRGEEKKGLMGIHSFNQSMVALCDCVLN
ncbi:hypothetical protein niasHT_007263 [Heterodera trifolii]|uniref:Uncharacterized protein n=1 Tax=Heterodera trifolii TaxID=157864 RepID=A0ABD2LLG3_9BILA